MKERLNNPGFVFVSQELVQKAIDNSLSVRESWERVPLADKIAIFHRAADMMATKYRQDLNATTMLGQVGSLASGRSVNSFVNGREFLHQG